MDPLDLAHRNPSGEDEYGIPIGRSSSNRHPRRDVRPEKCSSPRVVRVARRVLGRCADV